MLTLFSVSLLWLVSAAGVSPRQVLVAPVPADTACIVMRMAVEGRRSPLDSISFEVSGRKVKLCYGRPSARGQTMIGGRAVPYGRLWRTGANEPTMIHTTIPLSVAGIEIDAGTYSLYTVPDEADWQVIVNRSTSQWGRENYYTEEVRAQEVGRGTARSERVEDHIETFTIRSESGPGDGATIVLEWEHTRMRVPVRAERR